MDRPLPPLGWLRSFEASARRLSFAAAARELGLTSAAVSQQVRALEGRFGVALFRRLPRGLALTEAGAAYLPAVARALDELSATTVGLFGAPARRRVTLRSAVSFAALSLGPVLAGFRAARPQVELRLCSAIWGDAPADEGVDLEVRYCDGRPPGFDAWPLAQPLSIPVLPPGPPAADPAAALRAAMAGSVVRVTGCDSLWAELAERFDAPAPTGPSVDSSLMALELAAAGVGPALVAEALAHAHAARSAVRPLPDFPVRRAETHFLLEPRRESPASPDAAALRDWLLAAFAPGGGLQTKRTPLGGVPVSVGGVVEPGGVEPPTS